jgi:pretoxin HINT domain-containing protein
MAASPPSRNQNMTKHARRFVAVLSLALCCVTPSVQAAKPEADEAERANVQQVLQLETTTEPNAVNRREALQPTLRPSTKSDSTWWQSGYVKIDGEWRSVEKSTASIADAAKLTEYYQHRADAPKTADGQLVLANWCRKAGLRIQECAHLTQVLLLCESGRDSSMIYERLGYKRSGSQWFLPEEINEIVEQAKQTERDYVLWSPTIRRIARNLAGNPKQRAMGEQELGKLKSPESIPALVGELKNVSGPVAEPLIAAMGRLTDVRASHVLSWLAIYGSSDEIRRYAKGQLSARELDEVAPILVGLVKGPMTAKSTVQIDRHGATFTTMIWSRQTYGVIEVACWRMLDNSTTPSVRFDTVEVRLRPKAPIFLGRATVKTEKSGRELRGNADTKRMLEDQLYDRELKVDDYNQAVQETNSRVADVLSSLTSQEIFAESESIWSWWLNEIGLEDRKESQVVIVEERNGVIGRRLPQIRRQYVLGSCLVVGTPIWTDRGFVTIERIAAGDCVLAKNIETGELAYKPVVHTTVRQPVPVKKFVVNGQSIVASVGHNFWFIRLMRAESYVGRGV